MSLLSLIEKNQLGFTDARDPPFFLDDGDLRFSPRLVVPSSPSKFVVITPFLGVFPFSFPLFFLCLSEFRA